MSVPENARTHMLARKEAKAYVANNMWPTPHGCGWELAMPQVRVYPGSGQFTVGGRRLFKQTEVTLYFAEIAYEYAEALERAGRTGLDKQPAV